MALELGSLESTIDMGETSARFYKTIRDTALQLGGLSFYEAIETLAVAA